MDLFASMTPSWVRQGQRAAKHAARTRWEADCDVLLDRYLDNGEALRRHRERLRKLYPNNAEAMMDNLLTLNLVRKVVDTKAKLYRKPPRRILLEADGRPADGEHPARLLFERVIRGSRLNARMKWLLRLTELLNSAVLWGQVDWRSGLPYLTVLPPHHLKVVQGTDDPCSLQGAEEILVPLGGRPDTPAAADDLGYLRYRRITDCEGESRVMVERVDADGEAWPRQPEELTAYGALKDYPFVLLRKGEPLEAELFPDVPQGLLLAADWLDHELTRGALNSRQTDFPSYVFNGTAEELGTAAPATGAGAILCLGEEGKEMTKLPVEPREAERNANILFFLKVFAQSMDMTPSAFTFDVELLSGTAKFHDKQPEIEYREDQADLLVPVEEEEIWPMLRDLARIGFGPQADALDGMRMRANFPEQMIPLSREEELMNLEREIKLGLRSAAEILCERDGLGPEEAKQRVKEHLSLLDADRPA